MSDQFVEQFFKGISPEEQEMMIDILKRLAANANELVEKYDRDL